MMLLQSDRSQLVHSASDLTAFLECEALIALNLKAFSDRDLAAQRQKATRQAMAEGVEVIYQAALGQGDLMGHADYLIRLDVPSSLVGFALGPYRVLR